MAVIYRIPQRPAGISLGRAVSAGVVGACAMTVLLAVARAMGATPLNVEMMLGSMASRVIDPATWTFGFLLHAVIAGGAALAYAGVMEAVRRTGWRVGLGLGTIHAVLAGLAMMLLPDVHPLIPGGLPAPGPFASDLGFGSFAAFVSAHLAYGAIVGRMYALRRRAPEIALIIEPRRRRSLLEATEPERRKN